MPARRCLLTVHAHPDDEASKGAATVARYHADGVQTVLVCCTGGEEGDVLNPALDQPQVRADLPGIRLQELERSAKVIGYDEVVLLGYRDSGMPGTQANARLDAFANAPLDEAVGRLVSVVRRARPQVVVTYGDEQTEYPHPDHLRVHEITMAAWVASGDPAAFPDAGEPFAPSKLYYTLWPRRRMRAMHEKFLELGMVSPMAERLERLAREDVVTTSIDLTGYVDVRGEALRAHATQIDPTSPFWFGLPPEVQRTVYPYDDYFLAASRVGPTDVTEDDLFGGVD
ncbi:MAG: mycothiol conjugate amidase Mca [Acidimicrobiales bacterium]